MMAVAETSDDARGTKLQELIADIQRIGVECSQPDWDAYGAHPVSPLSLRNAEDFVRAMPDGLPLPEAAPEPSGGLSLDWIHSRSRTLSVSVGDSQRLPFAWIDGSAHECGVMAIERGMIPDELVTIVQRLFNSAGTTTAADTMDFRIADTFTDSLARLTGDEQKAVKTTAFDLQLNPASPGMSFHKLDKAKDKNFWSVRVNQDIRIIVHRSEASLLLCYVDHHDKAYQWAERRKLETHPKTGAAQLIEIREHVIVRDVAVPFYRTTPTPAEPRRPLANLSIEDLLNYGVPEEWAQDARAATEDSLLDLATHLPVEAAEALLELATGGVPRQPEHAPPDSDPFRHPDAQRRFRIMGNVDELERALDFPWEKWTVFLHPDQRQIVEREFPGPARVSGSAGTGKTIVALHRAVHLARANPEARVLLTTYSDTLASALHTKLKRLLGNEPRLADRIDVHAIGTVGQRLARAHLGPTTLVTAPTIRQLLSEASEAAPTHKFSLQFLWTEWSQVVDAWQLDNWEAYRDLARLGRKTRLSEAQRRLLWGIFQHVQSSLAKQQVVTQAALFTRVATALTTLGRRPFEHVVVDEAQDLGVFHMRFLAAVGGGGPNGLFFAGDLGQRIFQQAFSWKSVGVDVRGRSRSLRVNYRTSHQIRTQADRLLAADIADVDGNRETRSDTVSLFNGPAPVVRVLPDADEEAGTVSSWLRELRNAGLLPHEVGIFVRSEAQLDRARKAVVGAELPCRVLDEHVETATGHVSLGTMHLAKGLEFRAVVVMACDDEVIPLQERIEAVGDEADLQEVYDTERHLLYVACTRARDQLIVTGVAPASEFLEDFRPQDARS